MRILAESGLLLCLCASPALAQTDPPHWKLEGKRICMRTIHGFDSQPHLSLPEKESSGMSWVMEPGTFMAHIMIEFKPAASGQ
jgi:hypothetical protein